MDISEGFDFTVREMPFQLFTDKWFTHPQYVYGQLNNNIGLIKILGGNWEEWIHHDFARINSICWPEKYHLNTKIFDYAFMSGWGQAHLDFPMQIGGRILLFNQTSNTKKFYHKSIDEKALICEVKFNNHRGVASACMA